MRLVSKRSDHNALTCLFLIPAMVFISILLSATAYADSVNFEGGDYKGKNSRQPTVVATPRSAMDPASWMGQGYTSKRDHQLRNTCIPGTHDSGTYGIQGIDENISQTQELSIGVQLLAGYRYFDLRIKKHNGQFVIHHGPSISVAASEVFHDLKTFANSHPLEILFVHIQNVDSMSDAEHYELRDQLILPYLGSRMASSDLGNGVTFGNLWDADKNVILVWGGSNYAELSSNYWYQGKTLLSHWQNTGNEQDLIAGLRDRVQDSRGGRFYVAQMVLTPQIDQIIFPPYWGSIEDMTDDKLDHASLIYDLDMHARGSGQRLNIAMVDFAGHRFNQYAFEACLDVNDLEPRYFSLANKKTPGTCLDVRDGNTDNGTNVRIWECNNTDAQKWYFEHELGMLRSKLNKDKCLDNGGERWNYGRINLWTCNTDHSRFDFFNDSLRTQQNIDIAVDATGTASGSDVIQYTWHGGDNQRWEKVYEVLSASQKSIID